LTAIYIEAP